VVGARPDELQSDMKVRLTSANLGVGEDDGQPLDSYAFTPAR
jgi:hypothetical protein